MSEKLYQGIAKLLIIKNIVDFCIIHNSVGKIFYMCVYIYINVGMQTHIWCREREMDSLLAN